MCNQGYKRLYIQSAFNIPDDEKRDQELQSLRKIDDSFQKIVIVGEHSPRYQNEDGILFIDIYSFLMDGGIMEWLSAHFRYSAAEKFLYVADGIRKK